MLKQAIRNIQLVRFLLLHRQRREAIERWQAVAARKLVGHAARHVPAYRALFSEAGINPEDIRSMDDFRQLPTTNKDFFLKKAADEYLDGSRLLAHRGWRKTSGTSGKPLTLLASSALLDPYYSDFACFRFLLGPIPLLRHFDSARIVHINVRAARKKNQLFITITDFLSNMEGSIRKIDAYKPDVIASYASLLVELARKVAERPDLLSAKPRYAASFGEVLTPAMRRYVSEKLECEVYDRYGGAEIGATALECDRHDGLHVNVESAIVEVVDPEGNQLPPGSYGKIIVTDLLNYNMPFIRYDIGDWGLFTEAPCACGLETPRVWIKGRYSAFLTFGDRHVHHLEFDGVLDGLMNVVVQYQVVKITEEDVAVRVVPGPLFNEDAREHIRKKIHEILPTHVRVHVEEVAQIPKTPRGKSYIIADESSLTRETARPA